METEVYAFGRAYLESIAWSAYRLAFGLAVFSIYPLDDPATGPGRRQRSHSCGCLNAGIVPIWQITLCSGRQGPITTYMYGLSIADDNTLGYFEPEARVELVLIYHCFQDSHRGCISRWRK